MRDSRAESPGWSATLTPRGWGCALGAGLLGASWYAIGLRDVWYLAWLLAALVVVALACALVSGLLARFDVRVRLDEPAPFVGSIAVCTATVSHRLPWTAPGRLVWDAAGRQASVPLRWVRGSDAVGVFDWHASARGPQEVRVTAVGIVDPLGLVRFDAQTHAVAPATVLPRALPGLPELLEAEVTASFGGDAGTAANGIGDGGIGGGALREYRRGDASRQINWKQSARQGEWLVNLPEPATRSERALRVDCDADAYRSDAEFEVAVSAAAAIVTHWARSGHVVEVRCAGQPAAISGDVDVLLRALAAARCEADDDADEATAELLPGIVVTGIVHRRLMRALEMSAAGGTLITVRAAQGALPGAWRALPVREPS